MAFWIRRVYGDELATRDRSLKPRRADLLIKEACLDPALKSHACGTEEGQIHPSSSRRTMVLMTRIPPSLSLRQLTRT
jgi:hypothetical protein